MIIFDLDGTLANCEHRRHFVDKSYITCDIDCTNKKRCLQCLRKLEKDQPDWESFYEACDKDEPIQPVIEIFRQLNDDEYNDTEIQIWSGRCESIGEKTIQWIHKYTSFGRMNSSILKMRPIGDNTPDDQLKERWLDKALSDGKTIDFVFDNQPKVIRMWRRRGIFVFNCCQHD